MEVSYENPECAEKREGHEWKLALVSLKWSVVLIKLKRHEN